MKKYVCIPCGWIYDPILGDPDGSIQPNTAFEDIPDEWVVHYVEQEKKISSLMNKIERGLHPLLIFYTALSDF